MYDHLYSEPMGNVYTPKTKSGDWSGYVKIRRNAEVQRDNYLSFKETSAGHLHFAQGIIDCLELPSSHVFTDGKRNLPVDQPYRLRWSHTRPEVSDTRGFRLFFERL